MTDHLTIDLVDRDGALREAVDEIASDSRAAFLKKAVFAGGTIAAGGVLMSVFPKLALGAPSAAQDTKILNFALLLEELEADFYRRAIAGGGLSGEPLRFARVAGAHERTHVQFLRKVLGDAARAKPTFDFGGATQERDSFLATAVTLEDTGVGAYNGAAPMLRKPTLAAAATIVAVEAYHAAWVRDIVGQIPAPRAKDPLLSTQTVTNRVQPFIAS